jgi:hypothetical protein
MQIPDNYIAAGILAVGILLTIWCVIKGEGHAKQIKWILIFFFLAAFVMSDKFDTLKGVKVLADLTNLDQYVGQVKQVTAESIQKINENYEAKLQSFQAASLAKLQQTEKLANEAKALMRLSLEGVIYDEAIKNNEEIMRARIKNVGSVLFSDESERRQWTNSMLQALDKK